MGQSASVQQHADKYFQEYQQACITNPSKVHSDLARWKSVEKTIFDFPIERQAEYATNFYESLLKLI